MHKIKMWCRNTISYIKEEIIKPIYAFIMICYTVIVGSEMITPAYSVKGVLRRSLFFVVIVSFSFMFSLIEIFNIRLLTYLVGLLFFYGLLAAVQKRCCDFNYCGTFFILILTFSMFFTSALYFVDVSQDIFLKRLSQINSCLQIILISLFIIPSKKDVDMCLRSPLLKYPLIYTAICWILAITSTLLVNSYF